MNAWGGPNKSLSLQYYQYDRYGNRTVVGVSGVAADGSAMPRDGIPNLVYNATNNRITTAGFQYDSAGNQTRALAEDGTTWVKYEYDAANRLQQVRRDDAQQTPPQGFQYGSTNARLFDYDNVNAQLKIIAATGGTTLAEYTEFTATIPTWTKSYTYLGDSQLSTITPNGAGGETMEYNHPDRLGTKLITNQQTGSVTEQATLPFGRPLDAESTVTNNNKRFTSYDRSAPTGLDYAINRTYDSKQGRFTQVDPIGMGSVSLSAPQTLNLYAYCANDPVNRTDASGLGFFSFLKNLFRWIVSLFRSQVARKIAVKFVVSFVLSGGNFGVAIRSVLPDILRQLGLNPNPLLTPSWNPNLPYPISLGGIGSLSKYIILNFALTAKDRFPCPPSFSQILAQFGRLLGDLLFSQSGHLTNNPIENGGWIYQDTKGRLSFLRAEKYAGAWRRGAGYIDLRTNPPNIKGARVVARAHTHPYNAGTQRGIDAGTLYGGPSSRATNGVDADVELSALDKMPSLVVHQTGTSAAGVAEITITLANGLITRVNNEICGRAR